MKNEARIQHFRRILGVAAMLSLLPSCRDASPQITLSQASPDGKYLAELVELRVPMDRQFEVRITQKDLNNPVTQSIYRSPDEGRAGSERFLWSKDGRFLLLLGKQFAVDFRAVADNGEAIYLLYNVEAGDLRCNSNQVDMRQFDFSDLVGIDFGEEFRAAQQQKP